MQVQVQVQLQLLDDLGRHNGTKKSLRTLLLQRHRLGCLVTHLCCQEVAPDDTLPAVAQAQANEETNKAETEGSRQLKRGASSKPLQHKERKFFVFKYG